MNRPWKIIVAADEHNAIGKQGGIPWHLPEDFKWFKACTQGNIALMGRKTYENLPKKPLPGRANWILSRDEMLEFAGDNVRVFKSPEDVLAAAQNDTRSLWVCGGAQIYKLCLPYCGEIYLTRVKRVVENPDTFFEFDPSQFGAPELVRDEPEFSILKYTRIQPPVFP